MDHIESEKSSFIEDLEHIINKHCMENGSDTPDFILAQYLEGCLRAFDIAVRERTRWYGKRMRK